MSLFSLGGNTGFAFGPIFVTPLLLLLGLHGTLLLAFLPTTLAAGFVRRGLVDEYGLVVHPVILGSGIPFFPDLERPAHLRLLETRTFSSGVVYLRYGAR